MKLGTPKYDFETLKKVEEVKKQFRDEHKSEELKFVEDRLLAVKQDGCWAGFPSDFRDNIYLYYNGKIELLASHIFEMSEEEVLKNCFVNKNGKKQFKIAKSQIQKLIANKKVFDEQVKKEEEDFKASLNIPF